MKAYSGEDPGMLDRDSFTTDILGHWKRIFQKVCNLDISEDKCVEGDNSTVTDFEHNNVMFGPPLPPPSWQTKVIIIIVITKLFSSFLILVW